MQWVERLVLRLPGALLIVSRTKLANLGLKKCFIHKQNTISVICARRRRLTIYRCAEGLEALVYDEYLFKPIFYGSPVGQKVD